MGEQLLLLDDLKDVLNLLFKKFNQKFPSKFRIKKTEGFGVVLKEKPLKNKYLSLYKRNNQLGISRLGIIVRKKVINKAVLRNSFKRMIREVFRLSNLSDRSLDIVISVRCQPHTVLEGSVALKKLLVQI